MKKLTLGADRDRTWNARALRGWLLPGLGLAAWWAAFHFQWATGGVFVSPGRVLEAAAGLARDGHLWPSLGASLTRYAIGFSLGALAGLAVGIAFGVSRVLERMVAPTFNAIKQVSLFAWIPLISMWFGLGEGSKITVPAYAAFFPIMLNTFEGVRSVSSEHLEAARAFAFTPGQILRNVILPSALPSIFNGVTLSLIYSWLAVLGAEYLLTSSVGIGNLLVEGREHALMDQVLVGVVVVGLVGMLINFVSGKLESRLLSWRNGTAGKYAP